MALSIKEILKMNKGPLYKEARKLRLDVKQNDKKHVIQAALWPRKKDPTAFLKLNKDELVDKINPPDPSKKKWQIQWEYLKSRGMHEPEEGVIEEKSSKPAVKEEANEWIGREEYPATFKQEYVGASVKALKWDTCMSIYRDLTNGEFISMPSHRNEDEDFEHSDDFEFIVKIVVI